MVFMTEVSVGTYARMKQLWNRFSILCVSKHPALVFQCCSPQNCAICEVNVGPLHVCIKLLNILLTIKLTSFPD